MEAQENLEIMIPQKVIVTASGEFQPGVAVNLQFKASAKNDFNYIVFLNNEGRGEIQRSELLQDFDQARHFFVMDYNDPRIVFTGVIDARILSKKEVEDAIVAYNNFNPHWKYRPGYLDDLKRALFSNAKSRCAVNVEQVNSPGTIENEPQSLPMVRPEFSAFAFQAAKGSWASSVIVFFLLVFSSLGARIIFEGIALLLILAGLSAGIVALLGIRKHGAKGILAPALVGLVINGLLLFIFINNFLAARHSN